MKQPFLSKKTTNMQLIPVWVTLCLLLLAPLFSLEEAMLLIVVLGGLVSIGSIISASETSRNLAFLRNNGYYEQMCSETPEAFDGDYAFTNTFVFSKNRKICLPIERIKSVTPVMVNCVNNSFKSKVQLTIHMDNDEKYCFLLKTGALTEKRKNLLINCVAMLVARNPRIVINK